MNLMKYHKTLIKNQEKYLRVGESETSEEEEIIESLCILTFIFPVLD